MRKIRFTSKKVPRGTKLERAAGFEDYSSILYQGKVIGCVRGINRLTLFTPPSNTNFIINREDVQTHRDAVNFVKENAEMLWTKYFEL